MGTVAASGGYFISMAARRILAEPSTITGSIGVIMETFVFQGLLEQKLGIQPVVLKSGEKKDWPNPFRPVTDEQKTYLQDEVVSQTERLGNTIKLGTHYSMMLNSRDDINQIITNIARLKEIQNIRIVDMPLTTQKIKRDSAGRIVEVTETEAY